MLCPDRRQGILSLRRAGDLLAMGVSLTRDVYVSLSVAKVPRNVTLHADSDDKMTENKTL